MLGGLIADVFGGKRRGGGEWGSNGAGGGLGGSEMCITAWESVSDGVGGGGWGPWAIVVCRSHRRTQLGRP